MTLIKQHGQKIVHYGGKHSYGIRIKELNLTIDNIKQSKKNSDIYVGTSQFVYLNYDSGRLYFTKDADEDTITNLKFFDDEKKICFVFYYYDITTGIYENTNVKIKFDRQKYYDMLCEILKFRKK